MRNTNHARGMTLMELLVGIAILAILLAVGVPSLREWIIQQRVKAIASELVTDLQLARSESITRNFAIRVSFKSSPSLTCYTVHTGRGILFQECDCTLPAGTACNGRGLSEVKTVTVPAESGVTIMPAAPPNNFVEFGENARFSLTAGVPVTISDGGSKTLVVATSALVQRPSVCIPAGSSMAGFPSCAP